VGPRAAADRSPERRFSGLGTSACRARKFMKIDPGLEQNGAGMGRRDRLRSGCNRDRRPG
jgi:hypothetical protein